MKLGGEALHTQVFQVLVASLTWEKDNHQTSDSIFNHGLHAGPSYKLLITTKLDGVGPVDNRPSTDKLHHFVRKKIKK